MPLTAEQRYIRARNAADARHHPGADPADLERARIDAHISAIVKSAGRMTDEQRAVLGRLYRYGPAEATE